VSICTFSVTLYAHDKERTTMVRYDDHKAEVASLRAALIQHGVHSPHCASMGGVDDEQPPCDCGFDAACAP